MVGNVCDTAVEEWEVRLDDISNHDLELGLEGGALDTLLKLRYHPWVNLTRYHLEARSIKNVKTFENSRKMRNLSKLPLSNLKNARN